MGWRGRAGLGLVAAGCGLLALAVAGLPWYRAGDGPFAARWGYGPPPQTFGDVRTHFEIPGTGHEGAVYFGWLWWAQMVPIVLLAAGGAAGFSWPGARWAAYGIGAIGWWTAYNSFADIVEVGASVAQRADAGLWVAMAGYLLARAGSSLAQPGRIGRRDRGRGQVGVPVRDDQQPVARHP